MLNHGAAAASVTAAVAATRRRCLVSAIPIAPDECVDLLGLDVVHVLHGLPDLLLVGTHVNQEHLSGSSSSSSSSSSVSSRHNGDWHDKTAAYVQHVNQEHLSDSSSSSGNVGSAQTSLHDR
jgi:hypothetical protein